ncbi:MAG: hypothetical protein C0614_04760 [Desulfuromonas sp.]|nr:MAG: hypothetical protein C0614_04760 [Desulfuromonas sp.]
MFANALASGSGVQAGDAGNISISSGGDLQVGSSIEARSEVFPLTTGDIPAGSGLGGNISLTSDSGQISVAEQVITSSKVFAEGGNAGNAGNVVMTSASGLIDVPEIESISQAGIFAGNVGQGGNVTLNAGGGFFSTNYKPGVLGPQCRQVEVGMSTCRRLEG